MTKYSKDLRQKVIKACLEGKESFRKIAERFEVSCSFVGTLWAKYKEAENLETPIHPRGSGFKIDHKILKQIEEQFGKNSQLTHKQFAILYEQQTGVKIHESTVGRALARIRKDFLR